MSKVRLTLRASQLYWPVEVTSKGRVNQAYAVDFSQIPGSSGITANQVRHERGQISANPFRISSGDRRVCTTFALELQLGHGRA